MKAVICWMLLLSAVALGPVMGSVFNVDPETYLPVWFAFMLLTTGVLYTLCAD